MNHWHWCLLLTNVDSTVTQPFQLLSHELNLHLNAFFKLPRHIWIYNKRYFESALRTHEELTAWVLYLVTFILHEKLNSAWFLSQKSDHGAFIVLCCASIHINFAPLDRDTILRIVWDIAPVKEHVVTELIERTRCLVSFWVQDSFVIILTSRGLC
jgi:hypothetical protein